MISRDYTQEVGVRSQKRTMPRPVAFVVLAVVAVGMSFGVANVVHASKRHNAAEKAANTPGQVAPAESTIPAPAAPAAASAAEPAATEGAPAAKEPASTAVPASAPAEPAPAPAK